MRRLLLALSFVPVQGILCTGVMLVSVGSIVGGRVGVCGGAALVVARVRESVILVALSRVGRLRTQGSRGDRWRYGRRCRSGKGDRL